MVALRKRLILFLVIFVSLVLITVVYANSERLNEEFASVTGVVTRYKISPDKQRIVYIAEHDTDNVRELYSAPLSGGTPIKLNAPLTDDGDVISFEIAADSSSVFYLADQDGDGEDMLYGVPINGGAVVNLSPPNAPLGSYVYNYKLLNENVIAYQYSNAGASELYAVNLQDGSIIRLSEYPVVNYVREFLFDENSNRLVYYNSRQIFSINLDGSDRRSLISPLPDEIFIPRDDKFEISADSNVFYVTFEPSIFTKKLYSVPVLGGEVSKLTGNGPAGERVRDYVIDNSTNQVYFLADQADGEEQDIFSTPTTGGSIKSFNIPLSDETITYSPILLSPDDSTIIYRKRSLLESIDEYYGIPTVGGNSIKLTPSLSGQERWSPNLPRFTPDGESLIFIKRIADFGLNTYWIYSTSIRSGESLELAGPLVSDPGMQLNYQIDPTTDRIYYLINDQDGFRKDLYMVNMAGGEIIQINDSIIDQGRILEDFEIVSDGSSLIYRTKFLNSLSDIGLYSYPLNRSASVRLDTPNRIGGDISSFKLSADEQYAVYLADGEENNVIELFSAKTDGTEVVKLNNELVVDGDVTDFLISADSQTVVFMADGDRDERFELYSSPIDGGGATRLLREIGTDREVLQFDISADSQTIVFIAESTGQNGSDIYSMSINGGSLERLNAGMPNGGEIYNFKINSDSDTVVFTGNFNTNDLIELAAVPISGGLQTVLSDGQPMSENSEYEFGTDNQAIYFANQNFQVFKTPITGGEPLPITPNDLVATDLTITQNQLVFRGSKPINSLFAVYSVPLTGGIPFKINDTSSNVNSYKVERDTILYSADHLYAGSVTDGNEVNLSTGISGIFDFYFAENNFAVFHGGAGASARIYRSPISSGAPVNISGNFQPNSNITGLNLSGNRQYAFFSGDKETNNQVELFRVAVNGGEIEVASNPTSHDSTVDDFTPCFNGGCVIFSGDFGTEDVVELWIQTDPTVPSTIEFRDIRTPQENHSIYIFVFLLLSITIASIIRFRNQPL